MEKSVKAALVKPLRVSRTDASGAPPKQNGRIAQLVEQLTLNQRVLGSNPSVSTIKFWFYSALKISRLRARLCSFVSVPLRLQSCYAHCVIQRTRGEPELEGSNNRLSYSRVVRWKKNDGAGATAQAWIDGQAPLGSMRADNCRNFDRPIVMPSSFAQDFVRGYVEIAQHGAHASGLIDTGPAPLPYSDITPTLTPA
jgi:hypothetical protein